MRRRRRGPLRPCVNSVLLLLRANFRVRLLASPYMGMPLAAPSSSLPIQRLRNDNPTAKQRRSRAASPPSRVTRMSTHRAEGQELRKCFEESVWTPGLPGPPRKR